LCARVDHSTAGLLYSLDEKVETKEAGSDPIVPVKWTEGW